MTDGPSRIDPLVGAGPRTAVSTFRPGTDPQRVLILDGDEPLMADLASGDIRRFESGPSLALPMVSTPFDLSTTQLLLVQINLDVQELAGRSTLFSLALDHGAITVDEVGDELHLTSPTGDVVTGPKGDSPAIVFQIDRMGSDLVVSVRNAETLQRVEFSQPIDEATRMTAVLTAGGPSSALTGRYGRRRQAPVLVHFARVEAVDNVQRAVNGARRAAGKVKRRIS